MKITIYQVKCRACNKMFGGMTLKEAKAKHKEHIKDCETIKVLEKVHRFWKKAEKILGRKLKYNEVCKLLGIK